MGGLGFQEPTLDWTTYNCLYVILADILVKDTGLNSLSH